MAMRFNRNFNVNNVVKRLVRTVLSLYVGGVIMTVFGQVMNNTCSPFYTGASLIGWTVGATNSTGAYLGTGSCAGSAYTISSTTGSGVLAVVGIIAISQVVTEFITW